MSKAHMTERIDETHKADWHKYAGVSSTISLLLPILSEFEGIGEEVMMGVGGAGAASVFAILLKFGRVTSCVQNIIHEQDEIHGQELEEERERKKKERKNRKKSKYLHDPIGWDDSELSN